MGIAVLIAAYRRPRNGGGSFERMRFFTAFAVVGRVEDLYARLTAREPRVRYRR